ncbi:MAG: SDR family NAD(P)-dependent oxidoreductase [Candidatus Hodarchaeales archaeon]|jgi:NAD(P)-dependent dehydrogenase (short-subunit alcohol dehydrogenase family)
MKTCIVTGANRGIGRGISEILAEKGHHVVLVCRDIDKGHEALKDLHNKHGESSAKLIRGDLSSKKKVKALGDHILTECEKIDVLIHNAGIWPSKLIKTEDDLESAFMVNHLAPFFLNHLLLTRLKQSSPARIVLVNAGLYPRGNFIPELTPWGGDFSKMKTYMNTKLCGMLYMYKLAPMIETTGVSINAVHPGVVRTGLVEFGGAPGLVSKMIKPFLSSIERGARGPVNLALNSTIQTNGAYYDELEERQIHKNALDETLATRLWEISLKETGIAEYGVNIPE